ncbi:MAG: polysaccharide deacetylase family protein, partial [Thermomicrobiales bacterium]|nr:polysaccharide deacetylase family protein [Thermomicrobiales bacterium]
PPANADTTQPTVAATDVSGATDPPAEPAPTEGAVEEATLAPTEVPTTAPIQPTQPVVTGEILSPEQLQQYQPNELGVVPVFMYHNIVQEYGPGEEGDVLFRTEAEFRDDLQFLYDNNFYIITYREYIENRITAPAGKHPAVLVFDDSRPNQFYYNIAEDGSVTIDPHSAIGILEDFFSTHPDFGHTAMFGVIEIWCFDFEAPDQTEYCQQKLQWLVDNGYEVANHTKDHQDLSNVTTEIFMEKVGGTTLWLQEQSGQESATGAVVLPYGLFPDTDINPEALDQWRMVRNGFDYDGQHIQLISLLAAGAEPAPSPNSINFDPMSIARIGAKDEPSEGEGNLFLDYWFSQFLARPDLLYTSDGNPDTITVPAELPGEQVGLLDTEKIESEGKQLIEY